MIWITDSANAAVHHIGRRDNIRARLSLNKRLFHQNIQGAIIGDIAIIVDQAVLTVACIGIKRHVGQNTNIIAKRIFDSFGSGTSNYQN